MPLQWKKNWAWRQHAFLFQQNRKTAVQDNAGKKQDPISKITRAGEGGRWGTERRNDPNNVYTYE
jgi:hypothetical protein